MICFDTNVIIAFFNGRPAIVADRFADALSSPQRLGLPIIVAFELWHGAQKSNQRAKNEARIRRLLQEKAIDVLAFDWFDAEHAGEIHAHLERTGQPIGPYDVLIAAQARARQATLVTANTREFARVPGLALEDWSA